MTDRSSDSFVPFQQTDFIFSVVGEKIGFIDLQDFVGRLVVLGVPMWFLF